MNYSCEYEYNLESGREQQLLFGNTVAKLMELIRIFIKPEHFSTCRVDIYKFLFQILIITCLYSCDFESENRIPRTVTQALHDGV
jgi:hypothetical protein